MLPADLDPARDVTLLMMVRHMPDDDFIKLCHNVMNTGFSSRGFTLDCQCQLVQIVPATSQQGPVEAGRLTEMAHGLGGPSRL